MTLKRAMSGLLVAGALTLLSPSAFRTFAYASTRSLSPEPGEGQDQVPNRREITLTARNYQFSPARIEVAQDDLVKLTVQSEDYAYSITIDEYRVSRRVPAGGTTTLEFRADRAGTFAFYSNMTNDARHAQMRGELIVRGK